MIRIVYLFLLLSTTLFHAQYKLSGSIVNQNNKPVEDVHIHLLQERTNTDAMGTFSFNKLSSGNYVLYVSHVGYENFQQNVTITNQDKVISIVLIPKINYIDEVHIEKISHNTNHVAHSSKIKTESIDKFIDKAFAEVLKEISGVSVLKSGNAQKPMINGLHSSRIAILNHSVKMEDQQWGVDHAPTIDLATVGKIQVVKGSNALQYSGDAIGGLIIVEPLSIKKDTLLGKSSITFNTNGRGGSINTSILESKQKGISYDINAGLKYFGDKHAPSYVLSNTATRDFAISTNVSYTNKNLKLSSYLNYFNNKLGVLQAAHIGNSSDLYASITKFIPSYIAPFTYTVNNPKQMVSHTIVKLAADYNKLHAHYAFQFNDRQEFDVRRGANALKPALSLALSTHTLAVDTHYDYHNITFKAGGSATYQYNEARPETNIRPLIPTYTKYDLAGYGIATIPLDNTLTAECGVRVDYTSVNAYKYYLKTRWKQLDYDYQYPQFFVKEQNNQILLNPKFNYLNTTASLGLNYHILDHWNILPSISLVMRNPNPAELFSDGLHHATGMIELGSLGLQKEKGFKINTTFKYTSPKADIEISPYLNVFSNFIYQTPFAIEKTIRGEFLVWEYQQSSARIYGIDFASGYQINNHIRHKLRFSWLNGLNTSTQQPLIDMAPANMVNEISYTLQSFWSPQFILKSEYVAKQKRFPNNNFEMKLIENNTYQNVLVDISSTPSAYHLMHCEVVMQPKIFHKIKTTFLINLSNIFNVKYRDYLNKQRFFVDESGRNLSVQLKFNY